MSENQGVIQQEEKRSFFLKHYIFTSIVVVYISLYLAHLLAIHVVNSAQYIAQYISIFIFLACAIFISYSASKEKIHDKIWKKVVAAVSTFIGALLLLSIIQMTANTGIKGLQNIYIKKLEKSWSDHVENENFMEDLSTYIGDNADSLTEKELMDKALEYQEYVFIPAFNKDNQVLHLFMLPANYKK